MLILLHCSQEVAEDTNTNGFQKLAKAILPWKDRSSAKNKFLNTYWKREKATELATDRGRGGVGGGTGEDRTAK